MTDGDHSARSTPTEHPQPVGGSDDLRGAYAASYEASRRAVADPLVLAMLRAELDELDRRTSC